MLIYAHRGASIREIENTIRAFEAAIELGADGVELDVRRLADGALIVHHDAALADGRLLVELTAGEVPSPVPSLAEALDACGDLIVNVELKNSRHDPDYDPQAALCIGTAAELRRRDPSRYLVSSFDRGTLRRWRDEAPEVGTAYLFMAHDGMSALFEKAAPVATTALHPWDELVDAPFVEAAHAAGLEVNVWTVDDPDRIRQLAALGCDGVVTNVPDVAVTALRG